jgi:hypothetical protein
METPAVPRKQIPQQMWDEIRETEKLHHEDSARIVCLSGLSLRSSIVHIGEKHGFTESEMESRGLVEKLSRAQQYFQATA